MAGRARSRMSARADELDGVEPHHGCLVRDAGWPLRNCARGSARWISPVSVEGQVPGHSAHRPGRAIARCRASRTSAIGVGRPCA